MIPLHPGSIYAPVNDLAGLTLNGGGRKIDLHSTESDYNKPPALGWYSTAGYCPHFTVQLAPFLKVWQHLPTDRGAYTLADKPGGIATNRAGDVLIQIEIVGRAATLATDVTEAQWAAFAEWLHDLAVAHDVPWEFAEFVPYPGSYGLNAKQRMTGPEFTAFAGICGHQHTPENDHGDPGYLPPALTAWTPPQPPTIPDPEENDMPKITYRIRPFAGETVLAPGAWLTQELATAIKAGYEGLVECEFHPQALASQLAMAGVDGRALSYFPNERLTDDQRAALAALGIAAP